MDENSITIRKSDGESVLFNTSTIYEEMMQFFDAINEFIEEIKDSFTETIIICISYAYVQNRTQCEKKCSFYCFIAL